MPEHLTDGWEAATDPGDTLLRAFVETTATHGETITRAHGGRTHRDDHVALSDVEGAGVFDNTGVLLRPPTAEDLDATIEEVAAWFPTERPFTLLSIWPLPDLGAHGLQLMGHPPVMVRAPANPPDLPPMDLEVVEVAGIDAVEDFNHILRDGYPMPGCHDHLHPDLFPTSGCRAWVGYDGGRPVAVAGAFLAHGIIDVDPVATLPEVRGRGFGAMLTWRATLADPSRPAMLIASDDGQPIYRRMGYLPILRATIWFRPA